jgi:hypothetical protein
MSVTSLSLRKNIYLQKTKNHISQILPVTMCVTRTFLNLGIEQHNMIHFLNFNTKPAYSLHELFSKKILQEVSADVPENQHLRHEELPCRPQTGHQVLM